MKNSTRRIKIKLKFTVICKPAYKSNRSRDQSVWPFNVAGITDWLWIGD